ncbi:MAG: recombination protein RecA [Myxococcota bacterium]|jgi:recombination protein RecA
MTSRQTTRGDALNSAIINLERQFGLGTVMRLGEISARDIEVIPTGSLGMDLITGCGGYPRGRVVEVFGPESSGKTTLTLHAIASCQAMGGTAAFIDAEHALDPVYARALGVNLDELLISQPDSGEQALSVVEGLVSSGGLDLVVIDSVAALVPRAELAGEMGDIPVGLQARLMSQALRKLTGISHRTNTTIIFINQLRQKIGATWGNGEVTTGGNALKFYCSLRIDIRRIGSIKQGNDLIGNRTRIRIVKNKLAPPFQQIECDILYGRGICSAGDLLDLGESAEIVTRSGNWYAMGETRLGPGREKARAHLLEHPEVAAQLRQLILSAREPAVEV